ncbi:hypothetical protein BSFA1_80660 (plasmid) [Burkholderia sp. SFA1]|nr:putative lipoprotein transmembrane [Burkholderia sp. YI23]BBQ02938.1 hypothetical protein BSFA1_80660 [Burkholderia sp. SFA1]
MQSNQSLRLMIAIAVSVVLSACGGGGGGDKKPEGGPIISTPAASDTPAASAPAATPPAASDPAGTPPGSTPGLKVTGSASLVGAQNVAVVFAGNALKSSGLGGNFLSTLSALYSNQGVTPEGAFTALAANNGAMTVKLSDIGQIDDVAGNGQYAIGRWSAGQFTVTTPSTNNTQTIGANQGFPYAVGIPLDLYSGPSSGVLSCSYDASTKPTAFNGSVVPGVVNSALSSATINLSNKLISLNLNLDIGGDHGVTVTKNSMIPDMITSASGSTVVANTVGADVTKPYLVVSYGTSTPSSGDVGGIVVFHCQ